MKRAVVVLLLLIANALVIAPPSPGGARVSRPAAGVLASANVFPGANDASKSCFGAGAKNSTRDARTPQADARL